MRILLFICAYLCEIDMPHSSEEQSVRREAIRQLLQRGPAGTQQALADLQSAGCRLYAFSNGEPETLTSLLDNAGIGGLFRGIISVHETQSFKPDPSVYAFFLENTGALLGKTWLVSANPFDVIGAMEVGWKAAWLQRDPAVVFDPWDIEPTAVVDELAGLLDVV